MDRQASDKELQLIFCNLLWNLYSFRPGGLEKIILNLRSLFNIGNARDAQLSDYEDFLKSPNFQEVMQDTSRWHEVRDALVFNDKMLVYRCFVFSVIIYAAPLLASALAGIFPTAKDFFFQLSKHLSFWRLSPITYCLGNCVGLYSDFRLIRRWDLAWRELSLCVGDGTLFRGSGASTLAPKNAQFVLWLLVPPKQRRAAISELLDNYEIVLETQGARRACFACWQEVIWSVIDIHWSKLKYFCKASIAGTAFKTGIDWFMRHCGAKP